MKPIYEFLDVAVNDRVMSNVKGPIIQLFLSGKFTVEQQVSRFQKCAFFGELLDRITSIPENSFIAVNVGDPTLAASSVG